MNLLSNGELAPKINEEANATETKSNSLTVIDPSVLQTTEGLEPSNDPAALRADIEIMRQVLMSVISMLPIIDGQRRQLIDQIIAAHPAQREHFEKVR